MRGLDELLAPVEREEFFKCYWAKKSLLIRGGCEKVADLFGWAEINRVFAEHRLDTSQARLAHEGKTAEDLAFLRARVSARGNKFYEVDIPLLNRLLREGASLVLDAVDEMSPAVRAFCENVGRGLSCQISVNAYATWKTTPGFGVHWDDHDLFVVQIQGRKHWQLFGATRPYPLASDVEQNARPDEGQVEWEAVLEPGDVVYIPRGHWHGATGIGEPTLHLTCGFSSPTAEDVLRWATDQLKEGELFREDVPRFSSPQEMARYWRAVTDGLVGFLSNRSTEDYIEYWKAKNKPRPQLSLPFIGEEADLDPDAPIRLSTISHSRVEELDGKIHVSMAGKSIAIHASAQPVLELLLTGESYTTAELQAAVAGRMPEAAVVKLVSVLTEHGLAFTLPTTSA